jgi:hypothetical protein
LSSATPTPTVAVDTDVLSFIFKHDTRASGYLNLLAGQTGLISFINNRAHYVGVVGLQIISRP